MLSYEITKKLTEQYKINVNLTIQSTIFSNVLLIEYKLFDKTIYFPNHLKYNNISEYELSHPLSNK